MMRFLNSNDDAIKGVRNEKFIGEIIAYFSHQGILLQAISQASRANG